MLPVFEIAMLELDSAEGSQVGLRSSSPQAIDKLVGSEDCVWKKKKLVVTE